ncbi:MAG: HEPN domain-containing protein [Burkholderiales bacterium]
MSIVREVELRRRSVEAVVTRAKALAQHPDAVAVQADYARHLCVLISGHIEKSVLDIAVEYSMGKTAAPIRSYLESSLSRLTNVDKDRLLQVVGSFDATWRERTDKYVIDEKLAALNSIVGLRNNIAHGGAAAVSLGQVERYWASIQEIMDFVECLFFPTPPVLRVAAAKKSR